MNWFTGWLRQSGNVTPGHLASWTTTGVVQDAGTPANPRLTGGVGVRSTDAQSIAVNNAVETGPYSQIGLGITGSRANITVQGFGGGSDLPLDIVAEGGVNINGTPYPGPAGPYLPLAGGTMIGVAALAGGLDATFSQPAAASGTIGWLKGVQTFGGTISGAFGPMNILQITEDLDVSGGVAEGFWVQHDVGGSAAKGGRVAIQADLAVYAATGNTTGDYVALQGNAFIPAAISEPGGIIYGGNLTAQLFAGASVGTGQVVGLEVNTGIQAGSTALVQTGIQVVQFGNSAVAGTFGADSAYAIGYQPGSTGFDVGFRIAGSGGALPIKTTGTIFHVATAGTVSGGFILDGITFNSYAWKSPGVRFGGGAADTPNYLLLGGGAAGTGATAPTIYTQGSDTDVDMNLKAQGAAQFQFYSHGGSNQTFQIGGGAGTNGWIVAIPGIAASAPNQLYLNGTGNNLLLGGGSVGDGGLATNATSGFPLLPFTSNTPSGVPVNNAHGAAIVVNGNQKYLNIYVPSVGWYHVALTAGAA